MLCNFNQAWNMNKKTNCWQQRVIPSRILFHKFVMETFWVTDIFYKQLKLHEKQSEVSVHCIPVNKVKKLILYSGWNYNSCKRLINDMITALMERRQQLWANLRKYPSMCLQTLMKSMKLLRKVKLRVPTWTQDFVARSK